MANKMHCVISLMGQNEEITDFAGKEICPLYPIHFGVVLAFGSTCGRCGIFTGARMFGRVQHGCTDLVLF